MHPHWQSFLCTLLPSYEPPRESWPSRCFKDVNTVHQYVAEPYTLYGLYIHNVEIAERSSMNSEDVKCIISEVVNVLADVHHSKVESYTFRNMVSNISTFVVTPSSLILPLLCMYLLFHMLLAFCSVLDARFVVFVPFLR